MNLKIKTEKYLVVSEWEVEAGKEQDIKAVWERSSFKNLLGDYVLYKGIVKIHMYLCMRLLISVRCSNCWKVMTI